MIANRQVTPEGVNWLVAATDPFHDTALVPSGFPDVNTMPSVVQMFTFTQNVVAPVGITGSNPWEAHVFLAPFSAVIGSPASVQLDPMPYKVLDQAFVTPVVVPTGLLGIKAGYNVITGSVGKNWQTDANQFLNSTNGISYPDNAVGGLYRMVACGVEVVNTTAELYKGGSVTCYRAPSHRGACFPAGGAGFPLPCDQFELPPGSQTQAQLYPNSRTWSAAEGYYGIGTLNEDPPFVSAIQLMPIGWHPPSVAELASNAVQNAYSYNIAVLNQSLGGTTTTARVLPFDAHGCIFSGLNAQSTLQVTTKYMVERIPSITEPDLLVLCRPPTPYDSTVLEIYDRVIDQLPVGCMVKDNPLGEWFNDVLSTVAEIAPKIGNALGGVGSVLGRGIGSGAQMWLDSRVPSQPVALGQQPRKNPPASQPQGGGGKKRRRKRAKGGANKPGANNRKG